MAFPDASSQSLLLRGAQVPIPRVVPLQKRSSIACRNSREIGYTTLGALGGYCTQNFLLQGLGGHALIHYRTWDKVHNSTHYFVAHKAADEGNVVCRNGDEEEWRVFKEFPLLRAIPHIDALQPTAWVRSAMLFVFVSFMLGIRAASASQSNLSHVPVVSDIYSLKSSGVEDKLFASVLEVDDDLRDNVKISLREILDNLTCGDQEHGKASKAQANENVWYTTPRRNSYDDKCYALQDDNSIAYERYNDIVCNKFEDTFFEDKTMQHAHFVSSEVQMKTTVNKSSSSNGAIGENSVEDKFSEKGFQELGPASYKLMVPLRVVSLRGSVPPIWLKDFMLSQGKRAKFTFESQGDLKEIMSALDPALKKKQRPTRSILTADIVTLGDSWLHAAVSKRLIEPIENAEQHEWFNRLGLKWQAFLRRDQDGCLDPQGLIWAVPYRWGSMVIAFRTDKLSKNNIPGIEDWKDLWKPELRGKIAMVDSSREVVGAVLKSLGASYNVEDFDKDVKGGRAAVKQQFLALQNQVKVFDSVHYLKALSSDDVWVAVGWSSDVIPVAKRMSNVRVVAPKSGASLWADLWAIPAANAIPSSKIGSRAYGASPLVHQWFDFCLQPARGLPFKQGVFVGASPLYVLKEGGDIKERSVDDIDVLVAAGKKTNGPALDTNMIEGMPPEDSLEKSELLEPLSEKAIEEYRWLFSQVAGKGSFRGMLEMGKQFFKGGV